MSLKVLECVFVTDTAAHNLCNSQRIVCNFVTVDCVVSQIEVQAYQETCLIFMKSGCVQPFSRFCLKFPICDRERKNPDFHICSDIFNLFL